MKRRHHRDSQQNETLVSSPLPSLPAVRTPPVAVASGPSRPFFSAKKRLKGNHIKYFHINGAEESINKNGAKEILFQRKQTPSDLFFNRSAKKVAKKPIDLDQLEIMKLVFTR